MMPEAPVRFSTMNCVLSESVSLAARRRASGSTDPPGGYGDTNLTGLSGQFCATTGRQNKSERKKTASLERHISSSFELQHLARLVGRRDGQAELLDEAPCLRHLFGVGFRELAAAEPQAVFETDAHVAAHDGRHRG